MDHFREESFQAVELKTAWETCRNAQSCKTECTVLMIFTLKYILVIYIVEIQFFSNLVFVPLSQIR